MVKALVLRGIRGVMKADTFSHKRLLSICSILSLLFLVNPLITPLNHILILVNPLPPAAYRYYRYHWNNL